MSANQAAFPVAVMARVGHPSRQAAMGPVLGVSKAGFYAWRGRAPSARQVADGALLARVQDVHVASRDTYGAPRVHAALQARGERHGRKRIARLMRVAGLVGACHRKGGPTTTRRDQEARPAPDLVDQYLSIWSRNGAITPATVARLYGRRVDYYGHPMSAEAVYRDKLAFAETWPVRRYAAVPGTVTNDCTDAAPRCRVSAVMRWSRADRAGRGSSGTNTVRLDLARQDGTLKILRESGEPVSGRR